MGIRYESLDTEVRQYMIREVEHDIMNALLYISPRLTEMGAEAWPQILLEACEQHDDNWIAGMLRTRNLLRTHEERRTPKGGITLAKVPNTAADTLAEGEFNRFYARGLCAHILGSGGTEVQAYRGKEVENPRLESQAMIGRLLSAQAVLNDLRSSMGVEPALGLPPGPNSGLSIRRPQVQPRTA